MSVCSYLKMLKFNFLLSVLCLLVCGSCAAPTVICGTPQPPSNGSVNIGNQSLPYYVEGTTFTFQCDDGLFPNDASITTCTDMSGIGEWVPDPADLDCEINPAECPPLSTPNGIFIQRSNGMLGPGATVTLYCKLGYMPTEPVTGTCMDNLMWDPDPNMLVCVPVTTIAPAVICGSPQPPSHGSVNFGSQSLPYYAEGTTFTFQCDDGLFPKDTRNTTCTDMSGIGEWVPDPADLDCEINPAGCPPLTTPNGIFNPVSNGMLGPGAMVTLLCDQGFMPTGPVTVMCMDNLMWDPDPNMLVCVPVTTIAECPPLSIPNTITNEVSNGMVGPGATVILYCKLGFMPTESVTVTCMDNLMWDPDPNMLVCVPVTTIAPPVICGPPQPPSHGSVNIGNQSLPYYAEGTTVTFQCDDGLFPNDARNTTCTDMSGIGEWVPDPADLTICREAPVDCGPLTNPLNGQVDTSSGTIFSRIATYSCYTGYLLTGPKTRVCGANGQWNRTAPNCLIVDCGHLFNPEHGRVDTLSGTVFNSVAMYSCDVGYMLDGVSTRVCVSKGIWIPEAPRCKIIDCGPLLPPDNGQVVTSRTTYRSRATYTCNNGYILNGTVSQTCHHNQSWIPIMAPVCLPVNCGPLSNPENGIVDTSAGTSIGKRATYSCNTGYRLNGPMTRSCNSFGLWDPTAPSCYPVDCGPLPNPENGRVDTSLGTTFQKVSRYSCDVGHTLSGSVTRRCVENGQWIPDAPYCPIVDCGPLSNPEKGLVDTSSGTTYNNVALYTCIEGYVMIGEPERHCDSGGMWTPTAPSCIPVNCGPLDHPKNGFVDTRPDTYLYSTAIYSCNQGYNLTGNTQRVCQANGSWSSSAPYCADIAMVQLKFGPTSHCVEWSETQVELMYKVMRGSIFKAIIEKGGYRISLDKINKGFFTCYSSKTRTTYRTTITGLESVSAISDLAGVVQKWVESGATMRVLWYVIKIDKSCPVLISSMDEDECE